MKVPYDPAEFRPRVQKPHRWLPFARRLARLAQLPSRLLVLVTQHIPTVARISSEQLNAVYNGGVQAFRTLMRQMA